MIVGCRLPLKLSWPCPWHQHPRKCQREPRAQSRRGQRPYTTELRRWKSCCSSRQSCSGLAVAFCRPRDGPCRLPSCSQRRAPDLHPPDFVLSLCRSRDGCTAIRDDHARADLPVLSGAVLRARRPATVSAAAGETSVFRCVIHLPYQPDLVCLPPCRRCSATVCLTASPPSCSGC